MFYAAPVWMTGKENLLKKLWQDILKTTVATPHFHPSANKMEVITSLPPLDIQLKIMIVKYLIKNFYLHQNDLLTAQIHESRQDTFNGNVVKQHCNYLKEYIGFIKGYHRCQSIDLEYRESGIKYTKNIIWNFTSTLWKRRVQHVNDERDYTLLIKRRPLALPCSRIIESFICGSILNRLPLFGFLNKRNLADSPSCSCQTEIESADHLLFNCVEFEQERLMAGVEGTNIVEYLSQKNDTQPLCRLASVIYYNKNLKTRYDFFHPCEDTGADLDNEEH